MKDITHYFHTPDKESEVVGNCGNDHVGSEFDINNCNVPQKCAKIVKQKKTLKLINPGQATEDGQCEKELGTEHYKSEKSVKRSVNFPNIPSRGVENNLQKTVDRKDTSLIPEICINKKTKVKLPQTCAEHDLNNDSKVVMIDMESKENHCETKDEITNDTSCSEVGNQSQNAFQVLMSMRSRQTFCSSLVWCAEPEKEGKIFVEDKTSIEDEIVKKEVKRKRNKALELMAERQRAKHKKPCFVSEESTSENISIKKHRIMTVYEADSETELFDTSVALNSRKKQGKDINLMKTQPEKLTRKIRKKNMKSRKRRIVQYILETDSDDDLKKVAIRQRSIVKSLEIKNMEETTDMINRKKNHDKNICKPKYLKNVDVTEVDKDSSEETDLNKNFDTCLTVPKNNCQNKECDMKGNERQEDLVHEVLEGETIKVLVCESPDTADEGKKKKNILSYFNKISNVSVGKMSEKIEVKAQVHFPLAVSTRRSCEMRLKEKRTSTKLESLDEIIVVASENIELQTVLNSNCEKEKIIPSSPMSYDGRRKRKRDQNLPSNNMHQTPSSQKLAATTPPSSCRAWKMRIRLVDTSSEENSPRHAGVVNLREKKMIPKHQNEKNHCMKERPVLKKAKTMQKAISSHDKREIQAEKTKVRQERKVEIVKKSRTKKDLKKVKVLRKSSRKMQEEVILLAPRRERLRNVKEMPQRTKTVPTTDLAPVFMKRRKHCKTDTMTIVARQNFLASGVPDAIKKIVEQQRIVEELQHTTFPLVSHIQQKDLSCSIWNLPDELSTFHPYDVGSFPVYQQSRQLMDILNLTSIESKPTRLLPPRIVSFRRVLHSIKEQSPDFPVYRTFRKLRIKANMAEQESPVPWTDKYRPMSVDEVLGNSASVQRLRKWLEAWTNLRVDSQGSKKHKKAVSSGDEFVNSGAEEEEIVPGNSVVLFGCCGSGKTSALYAAANEIGCKVLELNSSSKRTGKRVLAELHEATQSHLVQSDHSAGISNFFKSNAPSASNSLLPGGKDVDQHSNKLSVILVEDADVVLEDQDEGFVTALSALVADSKRPVVLVTSSRTCPHLTRFMEMSPVLEFCLPPQHLLSVWLQLVCLVEGVYVSRISICRLLDSNNGDARRTLLQLQMWALTGGFNLSELPAQHGLSASDISEDCSNLSWTSDEKRDDRNVLNNMHCVDVRLNQSQNCLFPFPLKLGMVWWNVAPLLGLPQVEHCSATVFRKESLQLCSSDNEEKHFDSEAADAEQDSDSTKPWINTCSMDDMAAVARLTDVLSFLDGGSYVGFLGEFSPTSESCLQAWQNTLADGVSLKEDRCAGCSGTLLTSQQLSHWLAENSVKQCMHELQPNSYDVDRVEYNTVLPSMEELRWRRAQHSAAATLNPATSLLYEVERRAMALDYTAALRAICRLEHGRCAINTKRRSRFFHYVKGLGVHTSNTTLSTLCAMFR